MKYYIATRLEAIASFFDAVGYIGAISPRSCGVAETVR